MRYLDSKSLGLVDGRSTRLRKVFPIDSQALNTPDAIPPCRASQTPFGQMTM